MIRWFAGTRRPRFRSVTQRAASVAASVVVSPSSFTVTATFTTSLTATVFDQYGSVMNGQTVTWGTSDGTKATVNSSGVVTGVAVGSATITATSGSVQGTSAATVQAAVATVTVSPNPFSITSPTTQTVTADPRDGSNNALSGRSVSWQSSNTGVATVTPGSGYTATVIVVATGSATITATIEGIGGTATANCTATSGVVFNSDWSALTGTTDAAIYDQAKANPWQANASAPINGNLAILDGTTLVDGSGGAVPAPPDGIANVLRVRHPAGTAGQGHCGWSPLIWGSPAVGEHRYYRVYACVSITDLQGDHSGSFTGSHPFANTMENGDDGTAFEFEGMCPSAAGKFTWVFGMAIFNGAETRRTYPGPSQAKSVLNKKVWYRFEWGWTKTAANTFTLEDLRVYDNTGALLFDKNTLYTANGSSLLVGQTTGIAIPEASLNKFWLGTNGGGAHQGFTQDEYTFWAGLCVRSDTFCGAYSGGI